MPLEFGRSLKNLRKPRGGNQIKLGSDFSHHICRGNKRLPGLYYSAISDTADRAKREPM